MSRLGSYQISVVRRVFEVADVAFLWVFKVLGASWHRCFL